MFTHSYAVAPSSSDDIIAPLAQNDSMASARSDSDADVVVQPHVKMTLWTLLFQPQIMVSQIGK